MRIRINPTTFKKILVMFFLVINCPAGNNSASLQKNLLYFKENSIIEISGTGGKRGNYDDEK
jgi:hypothetical protein